MLWSVVEKRLQVPGNSVRKMNTNRRGSAQRDRVLKNADVFIVRIWIERRERPHARQIWRGMVEHLTTKERRYFQDLDRLVAFVREKSGVCSDGRPD
jgi:hypothetical protein